MKLSPFSCSPRSHENRVVTKLTLKGRFTLVLNGKKRQFGRLFFLVLTFLVMLGNSGVGYSAQNSFLVTIKGC